MLDVAFLMPVYQSNITLLDRSINSIITQNYKYNINLFVILDGFNIEIESYLKKKIDTIKLIKNRQIKYFVKANTGVADSLNYGLSMINEQFVFRQDDDDISLPERVKDTLEIFKKHPNIPIVGSSIIKYELRKGKKRRMTIQNYPSSKFKQISYLMSARTTAAHPTICFNFNVLSKFDFINKSSLYTNEICEDIILWYKLASHNIFIYQIKYPLVLYSIMENNYSSEISGLGELNYLPYIRKLISSNFFYIVIIPFVFHEFIFKIALINLKRLQKTFIKLRI